ncbi:hypothetical protein KVR01_008898 [Diaporthe batatas]|uniref:uncharacterized protein n=1 Tax=Diaporthe batatas TaxID=748121 RepID=UPI001D03EFBF|nr:uncharacterized protein KVR01_008898 [Diaporthe batatas]KAG8160634.1 hypothetical protein KVR01_008898 [Diaporthe batatas]
MARTGHTGPHLKPTAPEGSARPRPLLGTSWDPTAFSVEVAAIYAEQVNEAPESVILLPSEYFDPPCVELSPGRRDEPDAEWRHCWSVGRCWKTTVAYEQLLGSCSTSSINSDGAQPHPRLAAFIGRDPWTSLPVFAKPSGPPLGIFITQNKAAMYEEHSGAGASHRIRPSFRPLAYKWALHLASALDYVHAQDIILGDLTSEHCWLSGSGSSSLSLFLVGFLDACYRDNVTGIKYLGGACTGETFHPLCPLQPRERGARSREPDIQTDLFLWGCVVYEIMVGRWPGHEVPGRPWQDISMMIPRHEWPTLEREYLGQLVKGCWSGEVTSSRSLLEHLVKFLQTEGWQVEDGDDLQFDPSPLLPQVTTSLPRHPEQY